MRLAACLIVRDEAAALPEWILYHHLLGFDTILVVDHLSSDGTGQAATKAGRLTDVRLIRLDTVGEGLQDHLYLAVCRRWQTELDWIAFFDVDEFLVGTSQQSLHDLLTERAAAAAVAVPWLMFGSSGHVAKPQGLMIEDYRRRAPFGFRPNHHVKSIVRPSRVKACLNAHCFEVDGPTHLPSGAAVEWESPGKLRLYPEHEAWRLHHYFTRSRAHWTERLQRGQLGQFTRTVEDFEVYDRNEVLDEAACRHAEPLRRALERLRAMPTGRTGEPP